MSRISNTTAYPNITPTVSDYFVLTDAENNLSTKTCTIEELQTLFGLSSVSTTIAVSSIYLKALGTQSFTLLPAPGDGFVYVVSEIVSFMNPGNIVFDFPGSVNIVQGSITEPIPNTLLNSTTQKVYKNDPSPAEFIPSNTGIVLQAIAGPSAGNTGNGILYVNITYRKLKLATSF
jgi:hypothetical protein